MCPRLHTDNAKGAFSPGATHGYQTKLKDVARILPTRQCLWSYTHLNEEVLIWRLRSALVFSRLCMCDCSVTSSCSAREFSSASCAWKAASTSARRAACPATSLLRVFDAVATIFLRASRSLLSPVAMCEICSFRSAVMASCFRFNSSFSSCVQSGVRETKGCNLRTKKFFATITFSLS